MIEFISSWAQQIIVAVIVATIIEMVLPKGNNKKYIKSIIGVYILFTILSPIITKVVGGEVKLDTDYEKYFTNTDTYQTMSDSLSNINNENIEEVYKDNLKKDIVSKVKEKGYLATNVEVEVNVKDSASYGNINKITMNVSKIEEQEEKQKEDNTIHSISIEEVEKVSIGNTLENTEPTIGSKEKTISEKQKNEIGQYLSDIYHVSPQYIRIN